MKLNISIITLLLAALLCGCSGASTNGPISTLSGRIHVNCDTLYTHKRMVLWGMDHGWNGVIKSTLLGTAITDGYGYFSFPYTFYGNYDYVYLKLQGVDQPNWEISKIPTDSPQNRYNDYYIAAIGYKDILKISSTDPLTSHDTLFTNFTFNTNHTSKYYVGPFVNGMILDSTQLCSLDSNNLWGIGTSGYINAVRTKFHIDPSCNAVNVITLQIN